MGGSCPAAKIGTVTANGVTTYNPLVNPANGALINTNPNLPNFRKTDPSTYAAPSVESAEVPSGHGRGPYGHINVSLPANYNEQQYIGCVDYALSPKNTLFGRYFFAGYQQPRTIRQATCC